MKNKCLNLCNLEFLGFKKGIRNQDFESGEGRVKA
jgi:hypothetical protein